MTDQERLYQITARYVRALDLRLPGAFDLRSQLARELGVDEASDVLKIARDRLGYS